MNNDEYWKSLVIRIYHEHEVLTGAEDMFYRFSCIYGENIVDGIPSYFERRIQEYSDDLIVLHEHGFDNIAAKLEEAKTILFGDRELTAELVDQILREMYQDEAVEEKIDQSLNFVYEDLIEQLDVLHDYKTQLGIENGLFTE